MTFLHRFGIYPLDTDAIARALAATLLADYAIDTLEPTATLHYLRTRYMRLVADYGLPPAACDAVANKALALARQSLPTSPQLPFAFYE